jgi:hypothetical protein
MHLIGNNTTQELDSLRVTNTFWSRKDTLEQDTMVRDKISTGSLKRGYTKWIS